MLGLLYIRRLSQTNPKYLKTVSSRELFLIAMVTTCVKTVFPFFLYSPSSLSFLPSLYLLPSILRSVVYSPPLSSFLLSSPPSPLIPSPALPQLSTCNPCRIEFVYGCEHFQCRQYTLHFTFLLPWRVVLDCQQP